MVKTGKLLLRVAWLNMSLGAAKVILFLLILLTPACAGSRPDRILSGYFGFGVGPQTSQESIEQAMVEFVDPMAAAGFNAVDLKIWPVDLDMNDPCHAQNLRSLAQAIAERDMLFLATVYPNPYNARRDPQRHASLPALVRADGTVVEERFSLLHWQTWRVVFDNAFQLAQASTTMPIAAVKLDLETIHDAGISYDDAVWADFAAEHDAVDAMTPRTLRGETLHALDLEETYENWCLARLRDIVQRYEREMHTINPTLMLGMMPASENHFYEAFESYLATPSAPAIMDSWSMYNGGGFTPAVLEEQTRIKQLNPNNLFVPWFRINNYRPDDIAVQAYHAAFCTDGYGNWVMSMLLGDGQSEDPAYSLPQGYLPETYYAAYRRANHQLFADLAAGTTTPDGIPYEPVNPLAADLAWDDVDVPDLQPAGSGVGEPGYFTLRDRQIVYVYAQAGEQLRLDVRHLAGRARPLSLQYVILDPDNQAIRNESVMPGAEENINVDAPKTGTYALVITGGTGGQAWYGVRVHNGHAALRAERAYWFFVGPAELWAARTSEQGQATVCINTGGQLFSASFDGQEAVEQYNVVFDLPAEQNVHSIRITEPQVTPPGNYLQDLFLSVTGAAEPLLFDGPERRLERRQ